MTAADLQALLARGDRHKPAKTIIGTIGCVACGEVWPCFPSQLAAAVRALAKEREDAKRWRVGNGIARLDTETGDMSILIPLGSSENIEQHCGPWPESVRGRLLSGEELAEPDEVNAIFDHAMRAAITAEASGE